MPLQQTSGNVTADAYGGGAAAVPNYIEDVFSTYLYTGNGSTQTINNGIDLSGKGGLVWCKSRSSSSWFHYLFDTNRGATNYLNSDTTGAQTTGISTSLSSFNSDGFNIGSFIGVNENGGRMSSWTFREQPKFFDVVTYTGDGTSNRSIAHSLNATPGCIIVKQLNGVADWYVYHRSADAGGFLRLNLTNAVSGAGLYRAFGATQTSTTFQTGSTAGYINDAGGTYVAYLFAHNAGGFGLTGTDNVISCGSFTTNPSTGGATVNLGYEPQWLLVKSATSVQGWHLIDNMRGMANLGTYGDAAFVEPNTSSAESTGANCYPTANGFWYARSGSTTYIYIAIRRGPMKVPTDGTKVFSPNAVQVGTNTFVTTGFPIDFQLAGRRPVGGFNTNTRLTGVSTTPSSTAVSPYLYTYSSASESSAGAARTNGWYPTGFQMSVNDGGDSYVYHNFRRAPGFFDEVCYTGTGSATTFAHNLAAVPELMWVKRRNTTGTWRVYASGLTSAEYALTLNSTAAESSLPTVWNSTAPTSSVFSVGTSTGSNASGSTYVAYLFATCPGVSKVGSYTGNGTTQTINCGFTGGARFVLIKIKDSTGNWYVYDTARGMTTLTDPYLLLNSTAAESATLGSVTTVSTGFAVDASILAAVNTNGASYIFLAIA